MKTYEEIGDVALSHLSKLWPDSDFSLADIMGWITEGMQILQQQTKAVIKTTTFNLNTLDSEGKVAMPLQVGEIISAKLNAYSDITVVGYDYLQSLRATSIELGGLPVLAEGRFLLSFRFRYIYMFSAPASGVVTIEYLPMLPVFGYSYNAVAGTDWFEWDEDNIATKMSENAPPAEFEPALAKLEYFVAARMLERSNYHRKTHYQQYAAWINQLALAEKPMAQQSTTHAYETEAPRYHPIPR